MNGGAHLHHMVQKQSINENDILELYITNYSKVYHLREIGELLNKPHTTVKRYLQKLKKIIIEEKKKNANYYTLNINNILTIKYLANCENYRTIKIAEHKTIIKILL